MIEKKIMRALFFLHNHKILFFSFQRQMLVRIKIVSLLFTFFMKMMNEFLEVFRGSDGILEYFSTHFSNDIFTELTVISSSVIFRCLE